MRARLMARCASGNGLIAARIIGFEDRRKRSRPRLRRMGFNTVRGVQGINVMHSAWEFQGVCVDRFVDNFLGECRVKKIFYLCEYCFQADAIRRPITSYQGGWRAFAEMPN
jgi:hypothetical protein